MSDSGGYGMRQTKLSSFYLAPGSRTRSDPDTLHNDSSRTLSRHSSISNDVIMENNSSQEEPVSALSRFRRPKPRSLADLDRQTALRLAAQETKSLLPGLLKTIPHAPPHGHLYSSADLPLLRQRYCPGFLPAEIKVLDADSFDTAINVIKIGEYMAVRDKRNVCVLNMANAHSAGGGWLNGAMAQEEALCYRSSLSFSLKLRHYPLDEDQAIYSPTVVIIRDNFEQGHNLLDLTNPDELPLVSVISIAALCLPPLDDSGPLPKYRNSNDRKLMKEKMRIVLRTAAFNGHRRLVLGAFGCGAFRNPREEVADCWAEVLAEPEFGGGWWESICFAVLDDLNAGKSGNGNFGVFYRKLHGTIIR